MFSHNNILEIREKKPNKIEIDKKVIEQIVKKAGIKNKIINIAEPITWVMQLYKIYLEDGRYLLLKISVLPEWTDSASINNQVTINRLLASMGIHQPKILDYSTTIEKYGFLYILSEGQTGKKLYEILAEADNVDKEEIYSLIGKTYSIIHEKQNDWAGIWNGTISVKKYPIHPVDFYLNAELRNGGGKYLFENGLINKNTFDSICRIWEDNLEYLKERSNSLIHGSPFPWTIYLSIEGNTFNISGLSAYGDFMWWDNMVDVTHLLNPPFMNIEENMKKAFISNYNHSIDEKAHNLYLLLTRICAITGCYFAPVENSNGKKWIEEETKALDNLVQVLK